MKQLPVSSGHLTQKHNWGEDLPESAVVKFIFYKQVYNNLWIFCIHVSVELYKLLEIANIYSCNYQSSAAKTSDPEGVKHNWLGWKYLMYSITTPKVPPYLSTHQIKLQELIHITPCCNLWWIPYMLFCVLWPDNSNNALTLQSIYLILEIASSKFAQDQKHSAMQLCQE